jgi:Flp pilus assembly protein TadG
MTNHLRSLCRNDRGTAMMEMAIVLPILLMVMFGIAEFGIFFT